jgi:hypothetical protein
MASNDPRSTQQAVGDFGKTVDDASPAVQDDLRQQWIDAGLSEEDLDDLLDQLDEELP